jgi:serine/threonine-protein kinase
MSSARPMTPPPARPMTPPPASRTRIAAAPKRQKRGSAGLIATICVVVLLVVVTGIIASKMLNRPHNTNATGGSAAVTSTTTPPVPEVGVNTAPKLTYSQMRTQLINYYSLLPNDTQDAFGDLAPHYQQKTGFNNFSGFYAGISSVNVKDILPIGADGLQAVVTFVKSGGGTTHELYRFTFTIGQHKLLISNAVRVGGA